MTRLPHALGAMLMCTTSAFAQSSVLTLDEVLLSGGLTPIEEEKYGRSATVITSDELDARGITTVQDALRSVPGLSVSSSGGSLTAVRIRGGESNHTLILIDGIAAAGGNGEYTLSGLEATNIERIEVLRGPQSAIYGADASSGVINIVTKKGSVGKEFSASIEGGNGVTATAFGAARTEKGGLSFSISDSDQDGWDYSGSNGEKDGTVRRTFILSGDVQILEPLKLGFTFRRANERYDYDSTDWTATSAAGYGVDDATLYSQRFEQTAGVYAELDTLGGRLTHRLDLQTTDTDQSYNGGTETKTARDAVKYRASLGLDGTVADANHVLTVLVEQEEGKSDANTVYDRETKSIAAEYRASFDFGLDLQLGARHDDNDGFKDVDTWTTGLSYAVPSLPVRLHASAGKGSVKPTFSELYGSAWVVGNPDLEIEENQSWDAGIEFNLADRGTLDVTYFEENLTNEITYTSATTGSNYFNEDGTSERRGVEVAGLYQLGTNVDLRGTYTWLDATNPDGSVEVRRPEHTVTLGATVRFLENRASVSADLRYITGNYGSEFWTSTATGPTELPEVTTIDLAGDYKLNDTVTLTGRVVNLTDDDNVDVWGYAGRPRTVYAGIKASF